MLGTASVDLALTADTVQQLHLPVGSYKYQTSRNGVNCSQQVVIVGKTSQQGSLSILIVTEKGSINMSLIHR